MKRSFAILAQAFTFAAGMAGRSWSLSIRIGYTGLECLGLLAPREVAMKKMSMFLALGFDLFAAPAVITYYQRACGLHR